MALVYSDRVKETTTTTGTGAYILDGAVTGYQDFSVVGDTNTCHYCATDGTDWEVGIGTYTVLPDLARTTVIKSSNSDAEVDWGAGSKDIFIVHPSTLTDQNLKTTDVPTFDGLALTDDLTVTEASGAGYATLKGSTAAGIILQDTGGATGEQALEIAVAGELVGFNTLTDNLAVETFSDVLSFDLATGFAGIGGVPATDQLKVYGAVRASNLIGSNFVTKTDENYTCLAGQHVVYTLSNNSYTLTLPASPNTGDYVACTLIGLTSYAYELTIDGGSNYIICPEYGDNFTMLLYMTRDMVGLHFDGTRWIMVTDGRRPILSQLYNTLAQTAIANGVWTKLEFDVNYHDDGGWNDLTNERITARHRVRGICGCHVKPADPPLAAGDRILITIRRNGLGISGWGEYTAGGVHETVRYTNNIYLDTGEYIEAWTYLNTGGTIDTVAGQVGMWFSSIGR